MTLQSRFFRYRISAQGVNLEFVDRATGRNYLRTGSPSVCGSARVQGTEHAVTAVSQDGDRLMLDFGAAKARVVLRTQALESYVTLMVESVTGAEVESLTFLSVPLTLQARPDEPFGACAFSLNLQTRVDALPALQRDLRAGCYEKFGLVGARAAVIGAPMDQVLPVLKQVLNDADDMPHCRVAGPWARETPFNHGSYLFNFGSLTESTVDDWIGMARSLGVTQIDNHGGGGFFRFGDFALNREKWPEGWDTYKRIVGRLREAGISSIFHTYAFFIDKQSRYVTPVPDRRLDAFRTLTLAADLSADATEVEVSESTRGMNTVTGFFEHNSVVLHVDDELITFGSVSQTPPWRFSGLKRGALGTKATAHATGARARHLKECFGLFVPDVASSLFEEIARNHAEIVNTCGFEGIYLDAIDGSSILRGPEECWYWADKFVFEIQRNLRKPVGMEMSAMWHHFWQYRTRWQAWDYPQRGHQRFIDLHAEAVNGGLMLPLHLGWWNFQAFDPPQVDPTFPDVMECLGAKLIGWDAGISLTGAIDPARLKGTPLFGRAVDILRRCEELRRAGSFSEEARAKLRAPGSEFALEASPSGEARFRPIRSERQTMSTAEPWTLSWAMQNRFEPQPLHFRLEALMSTSAYDDPGNVVLIDPAALASAAMTPRAAAGVRVTREVSGSEQALLTAMNSGASPRRAAWARFDRKLEPLLNLKDHPAIGLAIEGDGLGELLGIRLESPQHLAFGAIADRYLPVDFTGRRVVSLVETESSRWSDYDWGDGKSLYNVYRESIDFGKVESLSLWLQNLPSGREARCVIGPVKALRMIPCTLRNPVLTVNGRSITLPVEMRSGSYLEARGGEQWVLYGPKGETLSTVPAPGPALELRAGENEIRFSCGADGAAPARARLVIFARGQPL